MSKIPKLPNDSDQRKASIYKYESDTFYLSVTYENETWVEDYKLKKEMSRISIQAHTKNKDFELDCTFNKPILEEEIITLTPLNADKTKFIYNAKDFNYYVAGTVKTKDMAEEHTFYVQS